MVFSLELLKTHVDYFAEYALTVGKSSQAVNNFKNSVLALTDKSKLASTGAPKDQSKQQISLA